MPRRLGVGFIVDLTDFMQTKMPSILPPEDGTKVQVYPYTLSDHHPINAIINYYHNPSLGKRKDGNFMLNTQLLKDVDCQEAIASLREIDKWMLKDSSAIER